MSKRVNRCLAALLAAVMVFTSADFSVFATGTGSSENWTATAAEIVAEHNGFSNEANAVKMESNVRLYILPHGLKRLRLTLTWIRRQLPHMITLPMGIPGRHQKQ